MAKSDLGQYGINLVSCHGSLGFAAGNASIIKWIPDSAAYPWASQNGPEIDFDIIYFPESFFFCLSGGRKWKVLPLLEGDGGRLARLYYSSYPLHDLLRPDTTLLKKNMIFTHFYISLFSSTKCWCETFLAIHQFAKCCLAGHKCKILVGTNWDFESTCRRYFRPKLIFFFSNTKNWNIFT